MQNGPIERLELRLSLMDLNRDQVETLHKPLKAADAVAETHVLLEAYLVDKAIYEVGYELNNRPDWLVIPFEGILQLLGTEAK